MSKLTQYDVPHEELKALADAMREAIEHYYANPPTEKLKIRDRPQCPYCIESDRRPRRRVLIDELGRPLPACKEHIYIPTHKGLREMPRMRDR